MRKNCTEGRRLVLSDDVGKILKPTFGRRSFSGFTNQLTMSLNPVTAQMILLQCTGDEIWSVETCRQQGIPELWIEELQGAFESGFDSDRNTIYEEGRMVNQYHGVLDLHLAYKLAEFLGIDWSRATATALSRRAEVSAIQAELDEL